MCVIIFRHRDRDRPKESQLETKIYNYVSGVESPLTWGTSIDELYNNYYEAPPLRSFWYIFCIFSTNVWVVKILRMLLHRIPAAFMSLYLILNGKNPKWVASVLIHVRTQCCCVGGGFSYNLKLNFEYIILSVENHNRFALLFRNAKKVRSAYDS